MKKLIIIIIICLSFQGCAMLTGRSLSTTYNDSNIAYQIHSWIMDDPSLNGNTHIVVAVNNGNVLLAGQVPYARQRIQAGKLARKIKGIKRIYNKISIAGPTSALTRSSDSFITSRIKTELFLMTDMPSAAIKVITENGVVYLMGNVTRKQANAAASLASSVIGVQKVVKLFG